MQRNSAVNDGVAAAPSQFQETHGQEKDEEKQEERNGAPIAPIEYINSS